MRTHSRPHPEGGRAAAVSKGEAGSAETVALVPRSSGANIAVMDFSDAQIDRYARHLVLPEIGEEGQAKLLKARVLVIGAGGLGSPLLLYLAAAGGGTLGIVDDETDDKIGRAHV